MIHRTLPLSATRILPAALVLALGLALAGCEDSVAVTRPAAPAAVPVTVAEVLNRPLRDWDEFTGRLEAAGNVDLRPRVGGYVERVAFTDGARVKQGELLFEIDPRPLRAEVARLSAERDRARAELALARSNQARAQRLLPQSAISREEADRLATLAITAQAALEASEAALARAQLDLGFTAVRAPVDGRVSRALITAGNLVSPDSVLTTLVADARIHVYFDADEHSYLRHTAGAGRAEGLRVLMGLADEDGFPHQGSVDFVDNRVDPGTGTIRVRASFDNADGRFTPGLYARVRLLGGELRDTVLIEDRAVGTDLGRRFVLVLQPDGTVGYRGVTLGAQVDGLRVVKSGLAAGETIVVNGLQRVRAGSRVEAARVSMQADGPLLRRFAAEGGQAPAGQSPPARPSAPADDDHGPTALAATQG